MKLCTVCRLHKESKDFHRKSSSRDGRKSECRECANNKARLHSKNPLRRQKVRANINHHRQTKAKWIAEMKEASPCMDCKLYWPAYVMDFDHRPGETKLINVSRSAFAGWTKKRILSEIAKCDLVCSNCHRIRTYTPR